MFLSFKFNLTAIAIIGSLIISTVTTPFSKIFWRNFHQKKDFVCCRKEQLVIYHYYTFNLLWIEVTSGYTEENIGIQTLNGCNLKSPD